MTELCAVGEKVVLFLDGEPPVGKVATILDVHLNRDALSAEGQPRLDLLLDDGQSAKESLHYHCRVPHRSHGEGGSYWAHPKDTAARAIWS